MRLWNAAIFAAFFFWTAATAQTAEVTLRFPDGSLAVTGPLLGFDGQAYRVETRFGELTFRAASVVCEGACPDADAAPALSVSGSARQAQVVFPALVQAFALDRDLQFAFRAEDDTHSRITLRDGSGIALDLRLRATTTAEGLADLIASEADLVLADRPVTAAEATLIEAEGLGNLSAPRRQILIGRSHLRIYAPRDLSVDRLDAQQLFMALSEGSLLPVHVASGDLDAATQVQQRLAQVLGTGDGLRAQVVVHDTAEELVTALAVGSAALGLSSQLLFAQRDVPVAESCAATPGVQRNGDASLALQVDHLVLVPRRRLPDVAEEFLVFLASDRAEDVIRRAGFQTPGQGGLSLSEQGGRLAEALLLAQSTDDLVRLRAAAALLAPLVRVPIDLRFDDADTLLPEDIVALRRFAGQAGLAGRRMIIAGFGDQMSAGDAALEQSRKRALAVADLLDRAIPAGPDTMRQVIGLGDALPVTCESGPWGAHLNRRVEIWVEP